MGIDPERSAIFVQSQIPAHAQLSWVLQCLTGFGEARRMTQFKDKSATLMMRAGSGNDPSPPLFQDEAAWREFDEKIKQKMEKSVSVGLFNYPVLMAADVLLYGAEYVPVGDDQTQHLEFMRDIAVRMNNKFSEKFPQGLFTVPLAVPKQHEFFGKDQGLRIRDLIDPTKKMSKSDETGRGVIFMSDTPEDAAKKVMSATTDSLGKITFDPQNQPGVTNLLQIMALLSGRSQQEVNAEWEGKERYGDFKKAVAEVVGTFLSQFQSTLTAVDDAAIMAKLEHSEAVMQETANATLLRVQKAVGLR